MSTSQLFSQIHLPFLGTMLRQMPRDMKTPILIGVKNSPVLQVAGMLTSFVSGVLVIASDPKMTYTRIGNVTIPVATLDSLSTDFSHTIQAVVAPVQLLNSGWRHPSNHGFIGSPDLLKQSEAAQLAGRIRGTNNIYTSIHYLMDDAICQLNLSAEVAHTSPSTRPEGFSLAQRVWYTPPGRNRPMAMVVLDINPVKRDDGLAYLVVFDSFPNNVGVPGETQGPFWTSADTLSART